MTREIDCLHPPDARFTTGKGVEKCAQCGKLDPDQDLQRRQDARDARIGRIVRETRPDLAADFDKLMANLIPPKASPSATAPVLRPMTRIRPRTTRKE